jgi:hypothetical protein
MSRSPEEFVCRARLREKRPPHQSQRSPQAEGAFTVRIRLVRSYLSRTAIRGKIVEMPNPPLATLRKIADTAGLAHLPPICSTDALPAEPTLAIAMAASTPYPKRCARRCRPHGAARRSGC